MSTTKELSVFLASLSIVAGLLPFASSTTAVEPTAYANFEAAQTNPIRLSADNTLSVCRQYGEQLTVGIRREATH